MWDPDVSDLYCLIDRVLQILCIWSYVHETGATIEITRTCPKMVHQAMMEWLMLKALHGINPMISLFLFYMECMAMMSVTGMCASQLQSLHYIASPGSRVRQNDCRMWNVSYKYKNMYTVQLKFSHKET
jgi:hypothetical protein